MNMTTPFLKTEFDYTYRADGQKTGLTEKEVLGGQTRTSTTSWSYDNAGRLTSETIDSASADLRQTESYVLDLYGKSVGREWLDRFAAAPFASFEDDVRATDDEWVECTDFVDFFVRVGKFQQDVSHGVQASSFLAVGLDHGPGSVGGIRIVEHGFFGFGVIIPFVQRGHVDGGEFPLFQGMGFPFAESTSLFIATDGDPELDQVDTASDQVPFELGCLPHELGVFGVAAEVHDSFDASSVVPGTIEHHDLAGGREVADVALEVPLSSFDIAWLFESHDTGTARVEVFHEAFDGPSFAGCVPSFEENDDLLPGGLDPGLEFEEFDLELVFLIFVGLAQHQVAVGVTTLAPVGREFVIGAECRGKVEFVLDGESFAKDLCIVGGGAGHDGFENLGQGLDVIGWSGLNDIADGGDFGFLRGCDGFIDHKVFDASFG